jgi:hypothetical protein
MASGLLRTMCPILCTILCHVSFVSFSVGDRLNAELEDCPERACLYVFERSLLAFSSVSQCCLDC